MATRDPVVKLRETRETVAGLRSGVVEGIVRCGRCGIHARVTSEVFSCVDDRSEGRIATEVIAEVPAEVYSSGEQPTYLLYDREEDLGALDAALAEAVAGTGGVLLIEGPAGIGKTVLLDQLRRRAIGLTMTVLTARGGELEPPPSACCGPSSPAGRSPEARLPRPAIWPNRPPRKPGLELLRQAADTLATSPALLWRAEACVDVGAALRHDGQVVTARPILRDGLDLAHRCGATPLADRAFEELRAAGGRPRRRAGIGADALTASERRVAELAAKGASNKEIAQSLFVTLRTVELHLSNAYSKLEIHSRHELAAALEP
jgi:DNA-binding CsgD family transcriptional regulator